MEKTDLIIEDLEYCFGYYGKGYIHIHQKVKPDDIILYDEFGWSMERSLYNHLGVSLSRGNIMRNSL